MYRASLRWATIGLGIHLILAALGMVIGHGDPAWFVHFGRDYPAVPVARQVLGPDLLIPHEDGHDGQAFWLLARNPLLIDGELTLAPYLDRPAYRTQRIAYPAAASVWRIGGERGLLWGLILTNLVVAFGGTFVTALLAADLGVPTRLALVFALCPAAFLATMLDLADGLAVAALLAGLLALRRRRTGWAVAAAVVAALTKEAVWIGFVGAAVLGPGLSRRTRLLIVFVPAAVAGTWALYVRWRLGWPPSGIREFALPFAGYLDAYRRGWRPVGNWQDAVIAVGLVPLAAVVIVRWVKRRTLILAAAVPFACLVPFFSAEVLDLALNTMRAISPVIPLLALDVLRQPGVRQ